MPAEHGPSSPTPSTDSPLVAPSKPRDTPAWLNGLFAAIFLYFFLSAINVMGSGLKTIGKNTDWLEKLLAAGDQNPLIALFGSVLITSIVQSSSFTTALIITLVATPTADGGSLLSIETAVYAVMGANIGTSVTNTIVSLGNVRIKRQFRRAFTAAVVHDIFNWLTVGLLFPLEWISSAFHSEGHGLLTRGSEKAASLLGLSEMDKGTSPIKTITKPVVKGIEKGVSWFSENPQTVGTIMAIVGLLMLFLSLAFLVKNLRGALLKRIEGLFRTVFFRNDAIAYVVGAIATVMVQSSSITTSLIVPLAGAGAVKLKRVFPFTLGANLGTTITGVIAATANPVPAAIAVAIAHVSFNLIGTAIWYPLRRVPIGIARWYGKLAAERKRYAVIFPLMVFIIIPLIAITITQVIITLTGSGAAAGS